MAKAPPPPRPNGNNAQAQAFPSKPLTVQKGRTLKIQKTVIYGSGGIGKSELCANIAQLGIEPLFFDLDMETGHLPIARVNISDWQELLTGLRQRDLWEPYQCVVIDSATKAEEYATRWVIANVKHEKPEKVPFIRGIEDYGWAKGYTHVYETFLLLLQELDAIVRSGRHVILTAHDCVANAPNPEGEEWIRYEPRLLAHKHASIRHRLKEWAFHVLFIGYDISVANRKATGAGTRTIYTHERPTFLAKSRTLPDQDIPYAKGDATLWRLMLGKEQ